MASLESCRTGVEEGEPSSDRGREGGDRDTEGVRLGVCIERVKGRNISKGDFGTSEVHCVVGREDLRKGASEASAVRGEERSDE